MTNLFRNILLIRHFLSHHSSIPISSRLPSQFRLEETTGSLGLYKRSTGRLLPCLPNASRPWHHSASSRLPCTFFFLPPRSPPHPSPVLRYPELSRKRSCGAQFARPAAVDHFRMRRATTATTRGLLARATVSGLPAFSVRSSLAAKVAGRALGRLRTGEQQTGAQGSRLILGKSHGE